MNSDPLSTEEIRAARAAAARGESLPLDTVRRFVLAIRKSFLASPKAVEKAKTTRNAKPKPDESAVDFI